jgi:hypothetical protein
MPLGAVRSPAPIQVQPESCSAMLSSEISSALSAGRRAPESIGPPRSPEFRLGSPGTPGEPSRGERPGVWTSFLSATEPHPEYRMAPNPVSSRILQSCHRHLPVAQSADHLQPPFVLPKPNRRHITDLNIAVWWNRHHRRCLCTRYRARENVESSINLMLSRSGWQKALSPRDCALHAIDPHDWLAKKTDKGISDWIDPRTHRDAGGRLWVVRHG